MWDQTCKGTYICLVLYKGILVIPFFFMNVKTLHVFLYCISVCECFPTLSIRILIHNSYFLLPLLQTLTQPSNLLGIRGQSSHIEVTNLDVEQCRGYQI